MPCFDANHAVLPTHRTNRSKEERTAGRGALRCILAQADPLLEPTSLANVSHFLFGSGVDGAWELRLGGRCGSMEQHSRSGQRSPALRRMTLGGLIVARRCWGAAWVSMEGPRSSLNLVLNERVSASHRVWGSSGSPAPIRSKTPFRRVRSVRFRQIGDPFDSSNATDAKKPCQSRLSLPDAHGSIAQRSGSVRLEILLPLREMDAPTSLRGLSSDGQEKGPHIGGPKEPTGVLRGEDPILGLDIGDFVESSPR